MSFSLSLKLLLLASIPLLCSAQGISPDLLLTPEKTDFLKTSTHSDVIGFLNVLKSRSRDLHVISMGKSFEGRDIPVAILSSPAVRTAEEAKATGKLIVYIQGNIHGGEVEGKEAIMMLMREILLGDKMHLLDSLVILFAPIYNTDSNDKMEKGRRPSQEDSPMEVGLRENSIGLDLNRDGIKVEAAETRALFSNIITKWDPDLFVDLHTTNGTWHAYSLTWAPSYHSAGEESMYNFTQKMLNDITASCEEKYALLIGPYGEYHLDEGWPPRNFYTYNHHPRYLVNQFGLRNRMAILSEAFSHERFYQRIHSTYHFTLEILLYARSNASKIRDVNREAESSAIQQVIEYGGRVKKGTRFRMASSEMLQSFRTYEYLPVKTGPQTLVKSAKIVTYDSVAYHAVFKPIAEAILPHGYIIPAEFSSVITALEIHGVKVERLTRARSFSGEFFTIKTHDTAVRKFEGHHMATITGSFKKATRRFKPGDYVVNLAQPLANLIFYMLEPESDDGFVTWNFFDDYLKKNGVNNKPVEYPVFKYIN